MPILIHASHHTQDDRRTSIKKAQDVNWTSHRHAQVRTTSKSCITANLVQRPLPRRRSSSRPPPPPPPSVRLFFTPPHPRPRPPIHLPHRRRRRRGIQSLTKPLRSPPAHLQHHLFRSPHQIILCWLSVPSLRQADHRITYGFG